MLLKDIKNSHPQCFFIIKGHFVGFYYTRHLVEHDGDVLKSYLNNNDLKSLDFMEMFYTKIRKEIDTTSQKCIMSRKPLKEYLEEFYEKIVEE